MRNLNELLGKHKIQPFECYVYDFVLLSQTLEDSWLLHADTHSPSILRGRLSRMFAENFSQQISAY
jgi:hypothetical protein